MSRINPEFDTDLTVGDLRKQLDGLPDNMPVFYQRIEDVYFEKHGWDKNVLKVPDNDYPHDDYQAPDDEYVRAFWAWKQDKHFLITAHY